MNRRDIEYLKNKIHTSYELAERGRNTLVSHYTAGHFSDFLFFDHGKGSKIYDPDQNEFIDCAMGLGPLILGHAHPVIIDAASEAIRKGNVHGFGHEYEVKFAELMVECIPEAEIVTFANSGTEATMHAIKLARAYTGKEKIAKFEGHYHGTHEHAQISGRAAEHGPAEAPRSVPDFGGIPDYVVENTITLSMNQPESLDIIRKHKDELAAVIVEPLPWYCLLDFGDFLKGLREVTKECNVLLIFDEVITGFRLGLGGAREYYGIVPDLGTYGKVIGGGFPVGAIVGTKQIFKPMYYDSYNAGRKKVFVTGTFSGNPVTCAAGIATIEYLKSNKHIYQEMEKKVEYMARQIESHAQKIGYPLQIKNTASFFIPYFFKDKIEKPRDTRWGLNMMNFNVFRKHMLKNGINLPEIGVFFISAAHDDEDCEKIISAFNKSIDELY